MKKTCAVIMLACTLPVACVEAEVQDDAGTGTFVLSVPLSRVVIDPGDPLVVDNVVISPIDGFSASVAFTTQGGSVGLVEALIAPSVPPAMLSVPLKFRVAANTPPSEWPFVITGRSGNRSAQALVVVHVGSTLEPDDAGLVAVPPFARVITIKAWGAAGAYGSTLSSGGGGGFTSATFAVDGGETLNVIAGTGGTMGQANGAGGGGGFSAVSGADGFWLIAGGGGGGGSLPGSGGWGGGQVGGAGQNACGGAGGDQNAGGAPATCAVLASPGGSLKGGDGASGMLGGSGGQPGGGAGKAGGGGGAGLFGGAGGGWDGSSTRGGGGGGSSFVRAGALESNVVRATSSQAANQNDLDYVPGIGNSSDLGPGGGRVVIRIPKP